MKSEGRIHSSELNADAVLYSQPELGKLVWRGHIYRGKNNLARM